jgi:hypothetical protein
VTTQNSTLLNQYKQAFRLALGDEITVESSDLYDTNEDKTFNADSIAFFFKTVEQTKAFKDTILPIVRLYDALLHRIPDPVGFAFWIDRYQSTRSLVLIADALTNSSEFKYKWLNVTEEAMINNLYLRLLGRLADRQGMTSALTSLSRKEIALSDLTVLLMTAEDPEIFQTDTMIALTKRFFYNLYINIFCSK